MKEKIRIIAVIVSFAVIVIMAVFDTFGIISYEQIMVFLKLRDPAFTSAEVSVHFIDVDQGDSVLIVSEEKSLLIDAGEEISSEKVAAYLKSMGIDRLDYIIATHPHTDHIGGLTDIIRDFGVGELVVPELPQRIVDESFFYVQLLEEAVQMNIKITETMPGDVYTLGKSTLEILAPCGEYEDINNYSIVAEFVHEENKFLFTADAETESEEDMLRSGTLEDIDVLKVGHHGSSTSSCGEFLEVIRPEFAVISCGTGNSYNHPSESVMERFLKDDIRVFRTDMQGDIIAESDGQSINFIVKGK